LDCHSFARHSFANWGTLRVISPVLQGMWGTPIPKKFVFWCRLIIYLNIGQLWSFGSPEDGLAAEIDQQNGL